MQLYAHKDGIPVNIVVLPAAETRSGVGDVCQWQDCGCTLGQSRVTMTGRCVPACRVRCAVDAGARPSASAVASAARPADLVRGERTV